MKNRSIFKSQEGISIVLVTTSALILMIVMLTLSFNVTQGIKDTGKSRQRTQALNYAEAGKEKFFTVLRSGTFDWKRFLDTTIYNDVSFGKGNYTVSCSTVSMGNFDTILILASGKQGNAQKKIEVLASLNAALNNDQLKPGWVRGAVTTYGDVTTLGNIEIDGRDHDTNGVLLAYPNDYGVYGVSTCGDLTQSGNSIIGGRGIPSQRPADTASIQEYADTTGYPLTPEAVFGLPPGTFDPFKIRPEDFTTPFHGIVYVEGTLIAPDLNNSTGILIIHKSDYSASIKNLRGDFKGMLIADDIIHINNNASLFGAVLTFKTFTDGNALGNGNADIYYSSYILNHLGDYIWDNVTKGGVNPKTVYWREF